MNKSSLGLSIGTLRTLLFLMFVMSSKISVAAGEKINYPQLNWSFSSVFGTFDRAAQQRGLQVYKEVCSGCHGLRLLAYRNLKAIGYNDDEIKAFAAENSVNSLNDDGEEVERPARPSDKFVSPYPNEQAARAANGGAYPPDLSLIVKARPDGANYLHALLTGYVDAPADKKFLTVCIIINIIREILLVCLSLYTLMVLNMRMEQKQRLIKWQKMLPLFLHGHLSQS